MASLTASQQTARKSGLVRLREDISYQGSSRPLQVDREHNIVRGIKICGLKSKNGRRYLREALQAAISLYEGSKCNVDHPADEDSQRTFASRFGRYSNVSLAPDGAYGDLTYNPKHSLAETFLWWCENDPNGVGMSHNATGEGEHDKDGNFVVTRIHEVHSIDLVADPAATRGLRESLQMPTDTIPEDPPGMAPLSGEPDYEPGAEVTATDDADADLGRDDDFDDSAALHLGKYVHSIAMSATLSKAEKLAKLKAAVNLMDDDADGDGIKDKDEVALEEEPMAEDSTGAEETEEKPMEEAECATGGAGMDKDKEEAPYGKKMESLQLLASKDANVKWLVAQHQATRADNKKIKAELDTLKVKEAYQKKRAKARKLCIEATLPVEATTEVFIEQLALQSNEDGMKRLIEDRKQAIGVGRKPVSAGQQHGKGGDQDFDSFISGLYAGGEGE